MKFYKILTALTISLTLFVSTIGTSFASSSPEKVTLTSEITNFVMVSNEPSNLEYTYDKAGDSYKVVEVIDPSFNEVQSQIFKKSENGSYELSEVQETTLDNTGTVTRQITIDNETKTEKFMPNGPSLVKRSQAAAFANSFEDLGPWTYNRTDMYSSNIAKLTVGAIVIVISNYVKGAYKMITQIAGLAYTLNTPTVYYTVTIYFRYINGTFLPRAENFISQVYSDSARTEQIGPNVNYMTYTPGWEPPGWTPES